MLAGAVGERLLWAFAILSSQLVDPEPGGFRAAEEAVWRAGDDARPLI
jgi:hypothetical protein